MSDEKAPTGQEQAQISTESDAEAPQVLGEGLDAERPANANGVISARASDADVQRYAAAIYEAKQGDCEIQRYADLTAASQRFWLGVARAELALVEQDKAEMRGQVEHWKHHAWEAGEGFKRAIEDAVRAHARRRTAEADRDAARAALAALTEKVEAMADEWDAEQTGHDVRGKAYFEEGKTAESIAEAATANAFGYLTASLRALLPVEPTEDVSTPRQDEAHTTTWGVLSEDGVAYGVTPNTREKAEYEADLLRTPDEDGYAEPGAKVREVRNCSWAGVTLYDAPAATGSDEPEQAPAEQEGRR